MQNGWGKSYFLPFIAIFVLHDNREYYLVSYIDPGNTNKKFKNVVLQDDFSKWQFFVLINLGCYCAVTLDLKSVRII